MPIEVRELVIKAVVNAESTTQKSSKDEKSGEDEKSGQMEYLEALVQSIADKNER